MGNNLETQRGRWRILCIDDEPDILEILRVALGTRHEVATARNGFEAVGMLEFCDADFILCDVRMPGMDGFQTVEAIRHHPRYTDVPVFFLTAETGTEMAKRGYAAGANLYLTKPFDPMRVLQNIDYFLTESGRRPRPKRLSVLEAEAEARRLPPAASAPAASDAAPRAAVRPRIIALTLRADQMDSIAAALRDRFECVTCADPMASLQQLYRYEPDLLIVNPAIPQLSGWGLVQMIRQNPRFRRLPILLLDDPDRPLDPRLIPTITDQPVLGAGAGAGEVLAAVERVVRSPQFVAGPKRAAFAGLQAEEEELRQAKAGKDSRRSELEEKMRDRYRRIQDFIDHNLG